MAGDESEPSTSGNTQQNQASDGTTQQAQVAAATSHIKLPAFWESSPKCWFLSAEIAFDANRISSDKKQFAYVVASLSESQADKVNFILQDPPQENRYETIKRALMERYSISEERKLETILSKIDIGDQRPSDLLHQIQTLADREFSPKVIKQLWIRQLPDFIQAALVPQQDKQEEALACIADKLHDLVGSKQQINSFNQNLFQQQHCSNNTNLEQTLQRVIDRLDKLEHNTQPTSTQNSRSKSPRRKTFSPGRQPQYRPTASKQSTNHYQQQPTNTQQTNTSYQQPQNWCWYHTRFGLRATKCSKPCEFNASHGGIAHSNSPNH